MVGVVTSRRALTGGPQPRIVDGRESDTNTDADQLRVGDVSSSEWPLADPESSNTSPTPSF